MAQLETQDCINFAHKHGGRIGSSQDSRLRSLIEERGCPEIMGFMQAMLGEAKELAHQTGVKTRNPLAWELANIAKMNFVDALEATMAELDARIEMDHK